MRKEPGTTKEVLQKLEKGTLVIRLQKNASTADGIQWDQIKTFDGAIGYVSAVYLEIVVPQILETQTEEIQILNKIVVDKDNKTIKCEEQAKLNDLIKEYPKTTVKNKAGETITDTTKILATGDIGTIDGIEYTIVKIGDVSGDGVIDAVDLLRTKKHLVSMIKLEGAQLESADVNGDDIVDAVDLLVLKKHLVKMKYIVLEGEMNDEN